MKRKRPGMLSIDAETLGYIIVKAREFDEQVAPEEPEPGSNPSDDKMVEVLEDRYDDPTYQELMSTLRSLNEDQRFDLVTLLDRPRRLRERGLRGSAGLSKLGYGSDKETLSHLLPGLLRDVCGRMDAGDEVLARVALSRGLGRVQDASSIAGCSARDVQNHTHANYIF